jgi:hypothetical protein
MGVSCEQKIKTNVLECSMAQLKMYQKRKYFDNSVKKPAGSRIHREMGVRGANTICAFEITFCDKTQARF